MELPVFQIGDFVRWHANHDYAGIVIRVDKDCYYVMWFYEPKRPLWYNRSVKYLDPF